MPDTRSPLTPATVGTGVTGSGVAVGAISRASAAQADHESRHVSDLLIAQRAAVRLAPGGHGGAGDALLHDRLHEGVGIEAGKSADRFAPTRPCPSDPWQTAQLASKICEPRVMSPSWAAAAAVNRINSRPLSRTAMGMRANWRCERVSGHIASLGKESNWPGGGWPARQSKS